MRTGGLGTTGVGSLCLITVVLGGGVTLVELVGSGTLLLEAVDADEGAEGLVFDAVDADEGVDGLLLETVDADEGVDGLLFVVLATGAGGAGIVCFSTPTWVVRLAPDEDDADEGDGAGVFFG